MKTVAVQASGLITGYLAELPYALLKKVSGRIINEVRGNLMLHVRVGQPGSPHAASASRFLFETVLGRPSDVAHLRPPMARVPQKQPELLS